ncbi:MAG: AtpZ/AtpI family protein [Pelagimonas sp.]|nr:AtpZ/AtpI family protein [Pelagimonas sp.]
MSTPDPKPSLEELDAKLAAYKAQQTTEKAHQEEHYSQANLAWRMVTEMVAGLGIGFGIGYGLDALFGTTPFLMIVFTLLGIGAGINVMLRTAKETQPGQAAAAAAEQAQAAKEDSSVK